MTSDPITVAPVPVLSSAQDALAAARSYADSIASGVIERDRAGEVPYAELAALDASGLLGITVPAAHFGPDLSPVVLAEVIRTIAAVDPAIAQIPQAHFLFVDVLATHGSPAQQRAAVRGRAGRRAAGQRPGRAGRPARPGPEDPAARRSRAAGPAALRLDGRKYYCTGAISARWIGVSALDDDGRLVLAFVERDAPGVTDRRGLGRDGPARHGQRLRDLRPGAGRPRPGHPLRAARSRCRSSSARGPSWCTPRSRSGSRAARCATPASSSGPGPGRSSRPPGPAGRRRPRPTRTRSTASAGSPPRCARPRRCSPRPRPRWRRWPAFPATPRRRPAARSRSRRPRRSPATSRSRWPATCSRWPGPARPTSGYDLSRHWRNARTHASHDPVDWKYHHVGNFLLNDVLPPNHGQL